MPPPRNFYDTYFRITIRLDQISDAAMCEITDHAHGGVRRKCVILPLDTNGITTRGERIAMTFVCIPTAWHWSGNKRGLDDLSHTVSSFITSQGLLHAVESGAYPTKEDVIETTHKTVGNVYAGGSVITQKQWENGERPYIANRAKYINAALRYMAEARENPFKTEHSDPNKRSTFDRIQAGEF